MEFSLETMIQGGAVGISLVLIYYGHKNIREHRQEMKELQERNMTIMSEVVNRNSDSHIKTAEALTVLSTSLPQTCKYKQP